MTRRLISQGSVFEEKVSYSRAVVDGDWIFVSGTTGYDYETREISPDVAEQTTQCLKNIEWALTEAGASMKDIVRVHYILPDASEFEACWPALRAVFDDVRPAATMFTAGLIDPAMKIEIEVTARKSEG